MKRLSWILVAAVIVITPQLCFGLTFSSEWIERVERKVDQLYVKMDRLEKKIDLLTKMLHELDKKMDRADKKLDRFNSGDDKVDIRGQQLRFRRQR